MTSTLVRGTVVIDTERCKGCELCITACPPAVLVMSTTANELGYRYPRLLSGCTGCRACHEVCPDFVFEVYKYRDATHVPAALIADDDQASAAGEA
jgi:2-oxoglutarate ferredoxin oxidoreductase subunit delta